MVYTPSRSGYIYMCLQAYLGMEGFCQDGAYRTYLVVVSGERRQIKKGGSTQRKIIEKMRMSAIGKDP